MASFILLFRNCNGESLRGRFRESLTPNFDIHHFLNKFILSLVFLGSFSIASMAYAFEDDGTWSDGFYWKVAQINGAVGPTKTSACTSNGGSFSEFNECLINNSAYPEYTIKKYSCPASAGNSQCGESPGPVNNCPSAGDTVRIARVENGFYENDVFISEEISSGTITIGGSISADGCGFARSTDPDFNRDTKTSVYSDNQLITWENYVSTGELSEPQDGQPQAIIKENLSLVELDGSTDTTEDSSTTVVADPVVSTDPDGSSVVTEQTTVVDTKNSGTKVETSDAITSVTESDGIVKNTITTTTTVTNPDGSKTVTTEDQTVYTQSPITNYTIDNSSNTISYNTSDGSSASQTSTTTDTYDSTGNQTGSETSTSSDGNNEVAEEQEEQAYCDENPGDPSCKEYTGAPSDGLYSSGDLTFESVLGGFQTRLNDTPVIQSATGFFDLNVSGSCQAWSVDTWVFSITFDQLCTSTFLSILPFISAILIAVASWLGFRIAFL